MSERILRSWHASSLKPERAFETLIEEAKTLVSGVIDVIRLEDPPRVTIIDFKSGEPDSDNAMKLDEDEMRLQISLYGLAAKRELEYEPELGLVRYLGEQDPTKRELAVQFDQQSLDGAPNVVVEAARAISQRRFNSSGRSERLARGNAPRTTIGNVSGRPLPSARSGRAHGPHHDAQHMHVYAKKAGL